MQAIKFTSNEPQILSLKETSGVFEGFNVIYECTDGRLLSIPRPAAVKLGMLDPAPAEEISVTKFQDGKSPAEWVFSLTARSEQIRAEREAEALAERTKRDLPGQLQASVLRQMPKSARTMAQDAPDPERGTGTYGAMPQAVPVSRRTPPSRVSYRVALRQITGTVLELLENRKEQWESDPRQGLISTLFISACKSGVVAFDFDSEDAAK